ncbi:hypothetical protein PWG14_22815 (plasmid) [Chromobacterium amazonense]|nr:hypothetical protein [Chromobacterium amazonense]
MTKQFGFAYASTYDKDPTHVNRAYWMKKGSDGMEVGELVKRGLLWEFKNGNPDKVLTQGTDAEPSLVTGPVLELIGPGRPARMGKNPQPAVPVGTRRATLALVGGAVLKAGHVLPKVLGGEGTPPNCVPWRGGFEDKVSKQFEQAGWHNAVKAQAAKSCFKDPTNLKNRSKADVTDDWWLEFEAVVRLAGDGDINRVETELGMNQGELANDKELGPVLRSMPVEVDMKCGGTQLTEGWDGLWKGLFSR